MSRQDDLLRFVATPIQNYESVFHCSVHINLPVLDECFCKVEDSLKKHFKSFEAPEGYEPNNFKIGGVICFWLRKLKPLTVPGDEKDNRFVNETVAFVVAYTFAYLYTLEKKQHRPVIGEPYLHDILTSFRYNSWSPTSMAFLFEGLCL